MDRETVTALADVIATAILFTWGVRTSAWAVFVLAGAWTMLTSAQVRHAIRVHRLGTDKEDLRWRL